MPSAANNDPVGGWTSSGTGALSLLQATSGFRPLLKTGAINGHPAVEFDGVDDYLRVVTSELGASLGGPFFTAFVVMKIPQTPNTRYYFDAGNNTGPNNIRADNNQTILKLAGQFGFTGADPGANVWAIICGIWNGTTSQIRINANSATTGNIVQCNGQSNYTLGAAAANTPSSFGDPTIAEIVVYNSVLSTSDETSERNALNAYYAIFTP